MRAALLRRGLSLENGDVLNDLDETIKEILVKGVPLDLSEIDVAFDAPTGEWSASLARPTINCYLYHMVENQDLRTNQWEMDRHLAQRPGAPAGVVRRMPFRVDCCYMVTAWANDPADEHRLLWRVLAALMRHSTLPANCLKGMLASQDWPMPTKIAQPEAPLKNPADFWSNMDGPIRAGFQYIVTLPLDPDQFAEVPLVLTRRLRTRFMDGQHAAEEVRTAQFGGWVRERDDLNAAGVADAEVRLVEKDIVVRTDEQGRFAFDRIPRGRYTLRASRGAAYAERTVEVPGEGYDLVLTGGGSQGSDPGAAAGGGAPQPGPGAPSDGSGVPPDSSSHKTRRR